MSELSYLGNGGEDASALRIRAEGHVRLGSLRSTARVTGSSVGASTETMLWCKQQ